jgi:hypothetical protein
LSVLSVRVRPTAPSRHRPAARTEAGVTRHGPDPIAFVPQQLTSYGGLELLRRYLQRIELPRRLKAACAALGGDYGGAHLALLLLALPYVGARRLEHLQYLVGDPLVRRFAGLARVPTARTVSNWLRRFTQDTLRQLVRLNQEVVLDTLARLNVPRLTLDVDGTVVRTGATAWAFRGFNPHHRKDRSYYPLLAHVAQTGHILRVKNRPTIRPQLGHRLIMIEALWSRRTRSAARR